MNHDTLSRLMPRRSLHAVIVSGMTCRGCGFLADSNCWCVYRRARRVRRAAWMALAVLVPLTLMTAAAAILEAATGCVGCW